MCRKQKNLKNCEEIRRERSGPVGRPEVEIIHRNGSLNIIIINV
jgi:hypothetical protein